MPTVLCSIPHHVEKCEIFMYSQAGVHRIEVRDERNVQTVQVSNQMLPHKCAVSLMRSIDTCLGNAYAHDIPWFKIHHHKCVCSCISWLWLAFASTLAAGAWFLKMWMILFCYDVVILATLLPCLNWRSTKSVYEYLHTWSITIWFEEMLIILDVKWLHAASFNIVTGKICLLWFSTGHTAILISRWILDEVVGNFA